MKHLLWFVAFALMAQQQQLPIDCTTVEKCKVLLRAANYQLNNVLAVARSCQQQLMTQLPDDLAREFNQVVAEASAAKQKAAATKLSPEPSKAGPDAAEPPKPGSRVASEPLNPETKKAEAKKEN